MDVIDIDPADLDAAVASFPENTPVYMVNLLRFRDQADYGNDNTAYPPCTGQEAYMTRYMPAFSQAVQSHGGSELVYGGIVSARLLGPTDETWHAVGVARYDSIQQFRDLVNDHNYKKTAETHRFAALADWRLLATVSL